MLLLCRVKLIRAYFLLLYKCEFAGDRFPLIKGVSPVRVSLALRTGSAHCSWCHAPKLRPPCSAAPPTTDGGHALSPAPCQKRPHPASPVAHHRSSSHQPRRHGSPEIPQSGTAHKGRQRTSRTQVSGLHDCLCTAATGDCPAISPPPPSTNLCAWGEVCADRRGGAGNWHGEITVPPTWRIRRVCGEDRDRL